ncbi:3-hydroxyacyl-CoA dehydrogenase [Streptomyces sp. SL13]|uniref:3-hydroxyacyl-CoA dehydrogenase n=1 Tax=Streptantibioticus silvisoli TaxID=2705255 RepID=A0AA90GYM2_9ACTN|nr:3-hydroxyacyl-CoA dehydrogenase [Streptantibioticus silvisoli]MDI5964290.1 3-hydroxyacyl-CoA dehydrogenase [Streptantibioticus silvisoli]MDI5970608.1 3-hydroxyacyl-CoA dehydrogenase [Streptantibioticus silvisoli]
MNAPHAAGAAATATVAVIGTGTMGQGIAQVALVAGHPVLLHDAVPGRAAEAVGVIGARLDRLVDKGRMTAAARDAARAAVHAVDDLSALAPAVLVVEAVAELLDVKRALFAGLEAVVADDCVLATNTSSLSVTAVAGALRRPERLVGLHFFNPAPLLPLVEVVSGFATDPAVADFAFATAAAWGKTPVRCTDTPGFVVNRVARPFYAEGFRLLEERAADPATIDAVLREAGGFRMGPFELTDLIGQDVNEAVTRSVWEAFFHDPKFTPSLAQRRLVESGLHGRKSGRGWYRYGDGATPPQPHTAPDTAAPKSVTITHGSPLAAALAPLAEAAGITVETGTGASWADLTLPGGAGLRLADGSLAAEHGRDAVQVDLVLDWATCTRVALAPAPTAAPEAVAEAVGLFQSLGKRVSVVRDTPGMIVTRTVAMLADLAADAVDRGVASAADVDTAMRLGVNYPVGPVEWGERLGAEWVVGVLDRLHAAYPTGRYAPCPELNRRRPRRGPAGVISS